jgi:hypothetical protein
VPYINQAGGGGGLSGVTITGAAVSGDVPVASGATAGTWAFPPGHEFGYDQITAPVNIVSTTEATGTAIISCAAHTFDGAPVLAQFYTPELITGNLAGIVIAISLFEGATQIARLVVQVTAAATISGFPADGYFRFTPTAASHTYTVTAFASNTGGGPAVGAEAAGTNNKVPAFMRFTKA